MSSLSSLSAPASIKSLAVRQARNFVERPVNQPGSSAKNRVSLEEYREMLKKPHLSNKVPLRSDLLSTRTRVQLLRVQAI